jgi:uncharacterized membrane protein
MLPGDLGAWATAINNRGDIVGVSGHDISASLLRGVIWHDLKIAELPSLPGAFLTQAMGINDSGQIAGVGLHEGLLRAFLLTPHAR